MSDEAGKEERSGRVRQILRSGSHRSQEVPAVIERHDDHDESTQDVHRNQSRSLYGHDTRFFVEVDDRWRTDRSHHAALFEGEVDISFIAAWYRLKVLAKVYRMSRICINFDKSTRNKS
jgi:hypothetical protein